LGVAQGCRIWGALRALLPGNFCSNMALPGNLSAKTDQSGNLKKGSMKLKYIFSEEEY
jgi:hypothetical protein